MATTVKCLDTDCTHNADNECTKSAITICDTLCEDFEEEDE